jgi:hypothetical protein
MTLDCSHNQRACSEHRSRDRIRMRPSVKTEERSAAPLGRKDQFCFKHIREPCGQARPTTEMLLSDDGKRMTENGSGLASLPLCVKSTEEQASRRVLQLFHHPVRPNVFPLHDVIDAAPCNLHDTEWSSAPTAFRRGIRNQKSEIRTPTGDFLISGF